MKKRVLMLALLCIFLICLNTSFAAENDLSKNEINENIVKMEKVNVSLETNQTVSYKKMYNDIVNSKTYKSILSSKEYKKFYSSKEGKAFFNSKMIKSFSILSYEKRFSIVNKTINTWNNELKYKYSDSKKSKVIYTLLKNPKYRTPMNLILNKNFDGFVRYLDSHKYIYKYISSKNPNFKYLKSNFVALISYKFKFEGSHLYKNVSNVDWTKLTIESLSFSKFKYNLNDDEVLKNSFKLNSIENFLKSSFVKRYMKTLGYADSSNKMAAAGEQIPTTISQSKVISISKLMKVYMDKYHKLPAYIPIDDYVLSVPEMGYLQSKTIYYKTQSISSNIKILLNIKNPPSPSGSSVSTTVYKKDFDDISKLLVVFLEENKRGYNYLTYKNVKVPYQTTIYFVTKVLATTDSKENLPASVYISIKSTDPVNSYLPPLLTHSSSSDKIPNSILNDKYNGESLSQYKKASLNAQSTDSDLVTLAWHLTKNSKNDLEKAKAVFAYVLKDMSYSFYYNTKYGAKNALLKGQGNCVDLSHAIVALSRANGLAARYVHGTCTFTSGLVTGHVWVQILVDGTWVACDASSDRNSFGVINNWNPKTYTLKGKYAQLSF